MLGTIRPLIGVALIALITAPSVAAAEVTPVSVTWECFGSEPAAWIAGVSGRTFVEDQVITCDVQATDVRVSGTETSVLDLNWVASPRLEHPGRVPFRGSWLLENQGGYWEGVITGYLRVLSWDPFVYEHVADVVARGHGSYEGMEYRVHMEEWFGTGEIR